MKKLLVLGASYTQTPLYELSKKMNVIFLTKTVYGNFDGKMN